MGNKANPRETINIVCGQISYIIGHTLFIRGKKTTTPNKNKHGSYENNLHFKKGEDISTKNAKEKHT